MTLGNLGDREFRADAPTLGQRVTQGNAADLGRHLVGHQMIEPSFGAGAADLKLGKGRQIDDADARIDERIDAAFAMQLGRDQEQERLAVGRAIDGEDVPVRVGEPAIALAVGNENDVAAVVGFERRAVADRDQRRVRQLLRQQVIELRFGRLIERCRRLVKEQKVSEKEALAKATNAQALEMNFKGIFLDEGRRILG